MTPVTITITENGDQLVIDVNYGGGTDGMERDAGAADEAAAVMIALFNQAMETDPHLVTIGNQAEFKA